MPSDMKLHEKITPLAIGLAVLVSILIAIRFGLLIANTQNRFRVADNSDVTTDNPPSDSAPGDQTDTTPPADDTVPPPVSEQPTETPPPPEESVPTPPAETPAPIETPPAETSPAVEPPPDVTPPAPEEVPPPESPDVTPPPEETPPQEPPAPEFPQYDSPAIPLPFTDVRSTIEAVTPEIDWVYTLRAGADYDGIILAKQNLSTDFDALSYNLEHADGSNDSVIIGLLCTASADIHTLFTLLAPGSDDSQKKVDAQNAKVISDLSDMLTSVEALWTGPAGHSTLQCQ